MSDKNQRPPKTAPDKFTNGVKKVKYNHINKLKLPPESEESSEEKFDDNMSISNKNKIQRKALKKNGSNKPKPQNNLVKLVDHDDIQEFKNFMKNKDKKEIQKQESDRIEKIEPSEAENLLEVLRRENKNLSQLAFSLFDKIKLKFEGIRPMIAPSVRISKEPDEENKIEIENINGAEEVKAMEIEENKPKSHKKRLIDVLKENINSHNEDIFDRERIKSISFEPVKESVLKMEVETNEKEKQETEENKENTENTENNKQQSTDSDFYIPRTISVDHTQENYTSLSQAVEDIKEIDFQRLEPDVYLNDTLINFYFKLVEFGFLNNERRAKVHIFNTYFMPKMRHLFQERDNDWTKFKQVQQKMEKWTKKFNPFQKDFLLIPVNDNEHWNMAILCYPSRLYSQDDQFPLVVYLDSISRMESIYSRMVYEFFANEAISRRLVDESIILKKLRQIKTMGFPHYQPMVPKQNNLTDCGLYLLQYVELFAESEEYILNNRENYDKTKWFPKVLISKKRSDMKKLITCLREKQWKGLTEYLEERNRRIEKYSKFRDQYDSFNQKEFEKALRAKYRNNHEKLAPEEIRYLRIDFYYLDSLENDEQDFRD